MEGRESVLDVSGQPQRPCLPTLPRIPYLLYFITDTNTKITEQYALMEASYTIVKLLQRFDTLENAERGPDLGTNPVMQHRLTMSHANGVHVRLFSAGQ